MKAYQIQSYDGLGGLTQTDLSEAAGARNRGRLSSAFGPSR